MDKKLGGFSFGFKAKSETGPLKTKSALSEVKEDKEETDFIKGLDGTDIKSVKEAPKKAGPLVIPLIQKNKWRAGSGTDTKVSQNAESTDKETGDDGSKQDLKKAAAKELIEAARRREQEGEDEEGEQSTLEIPLLMQNQVSDFAGYDKADVPY